jgi:hypothetical protein
MTEFDTKQVEYHPTVVIKEKHREAVAYTILTVLYTPD